MANPQNIPADQTGSAQDQQQNEAALRAHSSRSEPTALSSSSRGDGATGAATARRLIDQAKETAGQAYEVVTDKAADKLDEQKTALSGGLTTVADSVRQVSQNLGSSKTDSGLAEAAAKYTDTAARKLEDVAGYFETKGVREMARDLEGFARRNPAIFLGAAFGLGLLAARFLKSATPANYETDSPSNVSQFDEVGKLKGPSAKRSSQGNSAPTPRTSGNAI